MDDSKYLAHYGVIGMKWGQRKKRGLQRKIDKSTNAGRKSIERLQAVGDRLHIDTSSSVQKKLDKTDKEVSGYEKQINKINKKERNFGGAANRVKSMTTGEAVVQSALLGSYGALKYNQNRAEGKRVTDSVLNSIGPVMLNNLTLGTSSNVESHRRHK